MSEELRVVHAHGDHITVTEPVTGVELLSYVYRAEADWEAPKPYLHPLRTLAGDVVTDYRPNDHRWHKGLSLTASHLSGANLWGGNSYVHGEGYLALPERVGSMRHVAFDEVSADAGRVVIAERLTWHPYDGELWAEETRRVEIHDVDLDSRSWALTWTSAITNRRTEPLLFGSPTTAGREMAGYTGLFWRGPRAFRDGRIIGPDGEGPELMGTQGEWLALSGEHDGADGYATVVFAHAPENAGGHPAHWFVRNEPFAAIAPSWAFYEELELPPGETLTRRYRVVVADGAWERDDIAKYLEGRPW
ncbi:PmoA family protein [Streptomyces acidiscabies]|uniref:Oxidoreductase n=1 Tax=Streptomyces acidiscabies TaxID=42234 RepID=A0A0L0KE17_9ACTN|nr:PmoA family protein [Streptomyces acidiscabies]MBP5941020.1 oxidoreductase [Streptomyces sp. LBUM 1476]KND36051.1 oxidoreductase [Streptomyces acidiscabies]MBZ3912330.1 PmoA family protein [Streptomyces acidiscabies]MDX2964105.1 PmoA family protein [Streptomyces acidiscabies]MDX3021710.1 PmoA family protein [Streptomyces acidiscabies]